MKCIPNICNLKYSVTHRSDQWCHALMPLSSACFIIFTSCCFCCIMQWKEFLLGNRANKHLVWAKHRDRSVELLVILKHTLYGGNCIVKNNILMRIFSLTFLLRVYFSFEDRNAWNDSVSLEKYILWLRIFVPKDTSYSNFKAE